MVKKQTIMRKLPIFYAGGFAVLFAILCALADMAKIFNNPDGSTNWQHVTNWSSTFLIALLSLTLLGLLRSRKRAKKSRDALRVVRDELEVRVIQRTTDLEASNILLQEEVDHVDRYPILREPVAFPLVPVKIAHRHHLAGGGKRGNDRLLVAARARQNCDVHCG